MRFRFADVVVLSLLIVLLSGVFVAAQRAASEEDNRKRCASNLKQIGQAILLYANENKGVYPRTKYVPDDKPTWGSPYESNPKPAQPADPFAGDYAVKPNDVTAALYLLLRTQDITSEQFTCPSARAKRFEFGGGGNTAMNWTNWPGNKGIAAHLSYSYQNPYPSSQAVAGGFRLNNSIFGDFAVLADMNPGTEALLKLTPNSPPRANATGQQPQPQPRRSDGSFRRRARRIQQQSPVQRRARQYLHVRPIRTGATAR